MTNRRPQSDERVEAEVETGAAIDKPTFDTLARRLGASPGKSMVTGLIDRRDIPNETTGRIVNRPTEGGRKELGED